MAQATRALVLAKVRMIFPERAAEEMMAVLDRYGTEPSEREAHRVQLAILKLCDEEGLADPTRYVEVAKSDYRDVLAWAEFPNQMRLKDRKDVAAQHEARELDRAQYAAWLKQERPD